MFYKGYPLIESKVLVKGVSNIPVRRNKSKRIQKKWIKKYGYRDIPDPNLYFFNGKFIGHPITIRKIVKAIKEY